MIGGFLGAGKTTSVLKLADHFSKQGKKVGLITNDQGNALADTALIRSHGFKVEEIAGGCFCCRFNSLTEAAEKLTLQSQPDVFIAEPVGSCTDLVATVSYPLRRIYGDDYSIAPLSVVIDPIRASRILGIESGSSFSEKVAYIYRKQLEEADLIIVNKIDLLKSDQINILVNTLAETYVKARILTVSARNSEGLEVWFSNLSDNREMEAREVMNIDYDIYAEGEALLGWYNASLTLKSDYDFDGNVFMKWIADRLKAGLNENQAEIAHLKMTLSPDLGLGDIASINLVRNDYIPELSQTLEGPVKSGQVILNIRAETSPEVIHHCVERVIEECSNHYPNIDAEIEHREYLQPGKPVPTHRMTAFS